MPEELLETKQVNNLITLLRIGDAKSLTQLRILLSVDSYDLAKRIGVSVQTLELWEKGEEQPLSINQALWKIKLSSYIDEKISTLLGTNNNEITNKYWALMWDFAA